MINKYDNIVDFAESMKRSVTTANICKTMAALGKIFNPYSILEPNGGMGEILYYCDYGHDIDAYSPNIDQVVVGMDVDNRINFIKEQFLSATIDKKYDLIISQIPFSYGLNPTIKQEEFCDLNYMAKILELLNKDGTFVGLLPGRFLFNDYSLKLRQTIMKDYSLEIIVELPYETYKIKNHNMNIVVIKNKPQNDNVLIVDYNEDIDKIIHRYLSQKGDGFISKDLLNKRWNKYYHSNKFNFLNSYKPVKYMLLEEVSDFIMGPIVGKNNIKEEGDFILINKYNLVDGRIVPSANDQYIINDPNNPTQPKLRNGDLVINQAMNGYSNVAKYSDENRPAAIQYPYIIIRSNNVYVNKFMDTVSGLSFFEDYLNRYVVPPINIISVQDIRDFKIPIFDSEDLILIENKYHNSLKKEDLLSRLNNIKKELEHNDQRKENSDRRIEELESELALIKKQGEDSSKALERTNKQLEEEKEENRLLTKTIDQGKESLLIVEKMLEDGFETIRNDIKSGNINISEKLDEQSKSIDDVHTIVKDIHTIVTDLHKIQEATLEKLNKVSVEEEKEMVYKELTENIWKLIEQSYDVNNYETQRKQKVEKIEQEYKEKFTETNWMKLDKSSRTYLITARVVYEDLKTTDLVDFSPVCISLTKALEKELFTHLFDKMQRYFKRYENKDLNHLPDGILHKHNNKTKYQGGEYFSLGKVPYILGLRFDTFTPNNQKGIKLSSLNEFLSSGIFKRDSFKDVNERNKYIKDLGDRVDLIAREYRNPAAHKDSLVVTKADKCYEILIDAEKILIEFISKLAIS